MQQQIIRIERSDGKFCTFATAPWSEDEASPPVIDWRGHMCSWLGRWAAGEHSHPLYRIRRPEVGDALHDPIETVTVIADRNTPRELP